MHPIARALLKVAMGLDKRAVAAAGAVAPAARPPVAAAGSKPAAGWAGKPPVAKTSPLAQGGANRMMGQMFNTYKPKMKGYTGGVLKNVANQARAMGRGQATVNFGWS